MKITHEKYPLRNIQYLKLLIKVRNSTNDENGKGAYMGLNVYDMTPRGAYMGLNVHVMCKCICNRVGLIIKGPHVQCVNRYI
jgi:hypothetical protein